MSAKSARLARERAAAARLARERAAAKRRRIMLGAWAVGGVLLLVAVMVIVRLSTERDTPDLTDDATTSEQIATALAGVPGTALDAVARGTVGALPTPLTGYDPLVADGKPQVLYIGAEYCPFCAAQRWGLVIALERFGSFTGLQKSWSASDDVYPNTPTLSFHGATYTSDYVSFAGVEVAGRERVNGQYERLDQLTPEQTTLATALSNGSVPFTDFGNRFIQVGAAISPELFENLTHADVLAAIADPASPVGQAVLGSANAFTAAICELTGDQPVEVCTTAAVQAYAGDFGG